MSDGTEAGTQALPSGPTFLSNFAVTGDRAIFSSGSPSGAPTGTITVSETGVIAAKTITLTPGAPGESQADIDLPNISASPHTLLFAYSGDTHYALGSERPHNRRAPCAP